MGKYCTSDVGQGTDVYLCQKKASLFAIFGQPNFLDFNKIQTRALRIDTGDVRPLW